MAQFPPELDFLRAELEALLFRKSQGKDVDAGPFQEKLLAHFLGDIELNAKSAWFLQNLSPHLRRPEIERQYRLNYLLGRFAVPFLD